jgi:hypothetical protein
MEPQEAIPSFDEYHANKDLHEGSAVYKNIRYATQILAGIIGTKQPASARLRHYTCAPTSYILVADPLAVITDHFSSVFVVFSHPPGSQLGT